MMAERECERCGRPFEASGRAKYCSDDCRYDRAEPGRNQLAAQRTIDALRDSGQLDVIDDATVEAFISLAIAVDLEPTKADLWREYRAFSASLKEAAAGGSDDDTQAFLISIQTPRGRAAVGHSKDS